MKNNLTITKESLLINSIEKKSLVGYYIEAIDMLKKKLKKIYISNCKKLSKNNM
jgi:hypothetical protein